MEKENVVRLQDIADMVGVSRTTVSNVLHGNTKRVSPETADKIQKILKETLYQPNIGSMMLTGKGSGIIGFVIAYEFIHGYPSLMDSFMSALLSALKAEAEKIGYCMLMLDGEHIERLVETASRWNVEGLILIGYSEDNYHALQKRLNKKMVLIDTYTQKETYSFQNVGINDFDGGYQAAGYLRDCGYPHALFITEATKVPLFMRHSSPRSRSLEKKTPGLTNMKRWDGFRAAMTENGGSCDESRFVVVAPELKQRLQQYEQLLPKLLEAGAAAMTSDYNAIEMINFLHDHGIKVPEQVSVVGFDDCIYAEYIRPRLTTVHQDVAQKGRAAFRRLMRMIQGEPLEDTYETFPVNLVIRDSVRDRRPDHPRHEQT